MTAAAAPAAATRPAYLLLVLTSCYTLSFIDRQILSLLVGPIKADLKISDTQVGLLGGLAFSLFYTLLGIPIGRLVDRYSRRNIIATGVFFWSLMTATCAVARGFGGLFAARMGVGVGEATLSPAAVSLIADSVPREQLAFSMSVYGTGIYLGSGLAFLVGGFVVQAVSGAAAIDLPLIGSIAPWRVTFLVVGLPGILAALWVLTLREPPRRGVVAGAAGDRLTIRETIAQLRERWQSVGTIGIGLMVQAIALYAFMLWSPVVLQRSHGWSPQDTGLTMGILVLVGGSLGMLTGGRLSDRFLRQGHRDGALRVAALSSLGGTLVFALLGLALAEPLAILFVYLLGVFLLAMPAGSCYAASQMVLPNQVRGQAVALILFVANLGGLTLGPLLPGLLNDYVFLSEAALGRSLAITLFIATAMAALVFSWGRSHYRRDHERMNP